MVKAKRDLISCAIDTTCHFVRVLGVQPHDKFIKIVVSELRYMKEQIILKAVNFLTLCASEFNLIDENLV